MADDHSDVAQPILNIVGERVALGPMRRELMPLFGRWLNDLETTRALGDIQPPWTAASQESWYEREYTDPTLIPFTIYTCPNLTPIGTTALLDLDWRNRTAEFGIIIGERSARGKGYGTDVARLMLDYAFTALSLHTIMLTVYAFNDGGIRAYEKAGFRKFGRRHECYFSGGRRWDKVYMEALASECESSVLGRVFVPDEQ